MALSPFLCTNCGFWQRWFARPDRCPVCEDHRHVPPGDGWEMLTPFEVAARTRTVVEELEPGILRLAADPPLGIGPAGYYAAGPRVLFDAPPWIDDAALARLEALGGIAWAAASHPHAYGALWRAVDAFGPEVALHVADGPWAHSFGVTWPYDDDGLELAPGARLHHTGGHFAGHAVLHLVEPGILLCGDALKFLLAEDDPRRATHISCHKAFVRQVPLSRAELRRYRELFTSLDFGQTWTPFEAAANSGRAEALALLDALIAGRPSAGWREL